jgi:nucleoside-diphosphate-sugar epimerase
VKHVVIGGAGFLGGHLAQRLAQTGEQVTIVDLSQPRFAWPGRFVRADIRFTAPLRTIGLDRDTVVYHLAARQYYDPYPRTNPLAYFSEVNVHGLRNVLEVMEAQGSYRLIGFSTDMVYGLPQTVPVPLDHPKNPIGPYGASKLEAEHVCRTYSSNGFSITLFRSKVIMGPGRLGIFRNLFRLIQRNLPIPLIGRGHNCYQMISVFDCVEAVMRVAERGVYGATFNLGSSHPPRVRDLLRAVIRQAHSRSWLLPTPAALTKSVLDGLHRVGLAPLYPEQYRIADANYILDTRETEKCLGWSPQYSDEQMVLEAYRWYLKHSGS